ncbi:MAG: 3-isopropylmalate dehydratase, partial [Planctomycetota bacterium]
ETRLIEGKVVTGDKVTLDLDAQTLTVERTGEAIPVKPLGDAKPIIDAGGVFNYARQAGMLTE